MTDIIERLRQMPSSLNDACRTMDEAAEEIERLRILHGMLEDIQLELIAIHERIRKAGL